MLRTEGLSTNWSDMPRTASFSDTRQKGAETGSDTASSSTWIKLFEAIGWYPQLFESLAMRALPHHRGSPLI